jgi:hypothetical protein
MTSPEDFLRSGFEALDAFRNLAEESVVSPFGGGVRTIDTTHKIKAGPDGSNCARDSSCHTTNDMTTEEM